jgi:hypothetical protein
MIDSKIDCDNKPVIFLALMPRGRCVMDISLAPFTASVSSAFTLLFQVKIFFDTMMFQRIRLIAHLKV